MDEFDLLDLEKKIKTARITLFVVSGFTFVVGLILFFSDNSFMGLDSSVMVDAVLLGGCALLSYRYPLTGLCLAGGLYLLGQIFMIIDNPATVAKGFIMKGYIIYALFMGIKAAYQMKNYKSEAELTSQIEEIGQNND